MTIGHEISTRVSLRARRWWRNGGEGGRRREISRWHNQWTIRPVDSINPCYGAGLRVATTLTINSTRINVNRWHCAARLSRLVKTVEASRANEASSPCLERSPSLSLSLQTLEIAKSLFEKFEESKGWSNEFRFNEMAEFRIFQGCARNAR